ncbi:MAG TPA: ribonuclease HII [Candidatus Paceibacterota bacterium]|nr:ribonuclease HII [Candidatus Paceibacterota bacterium]HMP18806.1 ribonuclease HII [Candidatus Paceibacterota bacterium]HMP85301.1 ribonuclease HII [Candidatus Paceibacterota bacterium]
MKYESKNIIGIDEVGRGPLAGPVYVCGVFMLQKNYKKFILQKKFKNLKDSKKLSELNRELWFKKINQWKSEGVLDYCCVLKTANAVDQKGISVCIKQSIEEILNKTFLPKDSQILLDGSLSAPQKYKNQKTIIKGDEKIPIISMASVVAKVLRDKKMKKISKKFPIYYLDINKGYGTKKHITQIKKFGLSKIHRKTFCKNLLK